MISHNIELFYIKQLQGLLRSDWTDFFFILWDHVDSAWFVLIAIIAVLTLFNRKMGISLLLLFLISGIVNAALKKYFMLPRPCHLDPLVGIVSHRSCGFPSGAAQTATLVMGIAFKTCKSRLGQIAALVFSLTLYFSRIYLGVHFFTDIAGGIVIGAALLLLYYKIFPLLENRFDILAALLALLLVSFGYINEAFLAFGSATALWLSKGAQLPIQLLRRTSLFIATLIGTFLLIYLSKTLPAAAPLMTFLAGLWLLTPKVRAVSRQPSVVGKKSPLTADRFIKKRTKL